MQSGTVDSSNFRYAGRLSWPGSCFSLVCLRRFINTSSAYLKLPFKSDKVHLKIKNILKKNKIQARIVYQHTGSLTNRLCRSAFAPQTCKSVPTPGERRRPGRPRGPCITCMSGAREGTCTQKNVVYRIRCRFCNCFYIGETERGVATRVKEHNADARNQVTNTIWGLHYRAHHRHIHLNTTESAFSAVSIVAQESDRAKRRLREAVEIQHLKPQINVTDGWALM